MAVLVYEEKIIKEEYQTIKSDVTLVIGEKKYYLYDEAFPTYMGGWNDPHHWVCSHAINEIGEHCDVYYYNIEDEELEYIDYSDPERIYNHETGCIEFDK